MVLQTKSRLGGNPIILGRPWLETIDAYIGCRDYDMTIFYGQSHKNITLYPPTKPFLEATKPLWIEDEERDTFFRNLLKPFSPLIEP
jgi:hypothetical protein